LKTLFARALFYKANVLIIKTAFFLRPLSFAIALVRYHCLILLMIITFLWHLNPW